MRRGQRLLQHPDDGHDAGDRGLEAQLDPVRARRGPQLLAVLGEQLLVGGDDVLAGRHRAQHVVARGIEAAHDLDDEVRRGEDVVERAARARQHTAQRRTQARDGLDLVRACLSSSAKAEPTVPKPSSPTPKRSDMLDVPRQQVLVGLAAHDDARSPPDHHDRRPRHAVVGVRHREAVGARGRA